MIKRFSFYAEKTGQHYEISIRDDKELKEYNVTDDFFKSKDILLEVVGLLNHLHQENQELQEKIMKVKQSNNHYYTEYYKIEEENEQLRKEHQEMLEKYVLLKLKIGEVLNDEDE